MTQWPEDFDVRWSPAAHYDAGFQAIHDGDHPAALSHAALGILILLMENSR